MNPYSKNTVFNINVQAIIELIQPQIRSVRLAP